MTVKPQQCYYSLLLLGYMFRLLRVIIRPLFISSVVYLSLAVYLFVSSAFYCQFQLLAPLLTVLKLQDLLAAVIQSVCVCWDAGVRNDVKLSFCTNSPLCRS